MKNVYVGMSGGVDSSLSAALLKEQGYNVTGVYMKNWTEDLPGMKCPWADDLADAKRVAVQLGIDFKVFDFEKEYKHKVVDYMIEEYKLGRTPNPDIMCNQEVKFKLFLEAALEDGADMIATGHYGRVEPKEKLRFDTKHASLHRDASQTADTFYSAPALKLSPEGEKSLNKSISGSLDTGSLRMAIDTNKDQTYFLYRVTGEALAKTLFPLGEFTKPQVREMAKERGLFTAAKKDSQGICFVGKVGIRDFLSQYVEQKPGDIIDKRTGKVLGRHDGAIFYTLGQRHGLEVGGGLPYYVVGKSMDKNEVYVSTDLNDETLWKKSVTLNNVHWINQKPAEGTYKIRVRHRAPLVDAMLAYGADGEVELLVKDDQRAVAGGQSVVIYSGDECLGGGIVAL
ncbi:MAG TPA: tRNA-specific 2-thiouridylase [Candidatus Saccharimonadales bacterium]|nr:tRNA-specific 2-thiouridylase [Candidatus Saccharimonadales bacterium]